MTLNVRKSKHLLFHRIKKCVNSFDLPKLLINSKEIVKVDQISYLGVLFDDGLTWRPHIERLSKQVRSSIAAISKTKHTLPPNCLTTLLHALVLSRLRYCLTTWFHGNKLLLNALNKRFFNFLERLAQLNCSNLPWFDSLNSLYQHEIAITMYKNENDLLPKCFGDFFIKNDALYSINTRNVNKYHIPNCSSSLQQRSLSFIGPRIWSNLPKCLTDQANNNTLIQFSKLLKCHLLDLDNDFCIVTG